MILATNGKVILEGSIPVILVETEDILKSVEEGLKEKLGDEEGNDMMQLMFKVHSMNEDEKDEFLDKEYQKCSEEDREAISILVKEYLGDESE